MKITNMSLDQLVAQMERAMNVMADRQQITASNVANLDTPGYKTVDVDFNAALQKAMGSRGSDLPLRTTHPGHLPDAEEGAAPRPRRVEGLTTRHDGNDVSIDREMMALAQTRLRYEVSAALVRTRLRQIRSALAEGRNG